MHSLRCKSLRTLSTRDYTEITSESLMETSRSVTLVVARMMSSKIRKEVATMAKRKKASKKAKRAPKRKAAKKAPKRRKAKKGKRK